MKNRLREKYKNGEVAIGTFFSMGDMNCMECLGFSGMDYVIIDTEHGPYDTESMMDMLLNGNRADDRRVWLQANGSLAEDAE